MSIHLSTRLHLAIPKLQMRNRWSSEMYGMDK